MEECNSLLLEIWREACKHIEIGEAAALMAPILARRWPLEMMLVRRIDPKRSCVETVGVGLCGSATAPEHTRNELSAGQLEELLAWARQGQILHFHRPSSAPVPVGVLPEAVRNDMLVGPLTSAEGPIGLVVLIAREGACFHPASLPVLERLLEPFSVALENDSRLRELRVLREAAEADRRSLLTKLGRQDFHEEIVGADGGLKPVMDRVHQVARLDVPVLILGETGSGKEVIARAIHTRSQRANGPFLRVNCGAIPSELIDSELFGHERGSFTGAIATRKGWFERADGGTLFLDEIGELPPAAQVRLLRVLQDGVFERVGGQRQMVVDVRIVAATHRNLQEMVAAGQFREDLWYRIAVFPIDLPSLRDRPEDIPALAAHFALRACRRFGFRPLAPTAADIELLRSYHWPGNVRELAAVMDRAAILGDGKTLEVFTALGAAPTVGAAARCATSSRQDNSAPSTKGNGLPTLDEAMAGHICAVLEYTGGQIEGDKGAARLLDINPHTLRARMRKLGIDWQRFRK
ncbi:MAG TPA: sigma 54-interacting transcriptional regulator [Phycisphaerae bacterium]|mgnify:CR=1 FL=1|nr:sigma 54-interacting transcriptional regulator [Phycisphaerae bacterium]HOJ75451.1 sigma 54-interacting transcriptional regulator [Phycisphaerae bacterium]HOM52251.1 sigma 54-interacting transcriptional regulator [Phycisphaerae bacterium]HON65849.1 sigma 54-interacting transcriptional regulator [Phycisphaerae bacterium]HOQ84145.1 sigma 54-interacting transcriptional regulator [Phycisphaerae bacterium]